MTMERQAVHARSGPA